jgi:hypothetical protein
MAKFGLTENDLRAIVGVKNNKGKESQFIKKKEIKEEGRDELKKEHHR